MPQELKRPAEKRNSPDTIERKMTELVDALNEKGIGTMLHPMNSQERTDCGAEETALLKFLKFFRR